MSIETYPSSSTNSANAGAQQDPSPMALQSEPRGLQSLKSHRPSQVDRERLNGLLRHALAACGPRASKHDLAIIGITICLDQGVVTLPHLIRVRGAFTRGMLLAP